MPRHFTGEDALQARVIALLRMHGVHAFHCPNETIGGDAYRSKRWAMGVEPGIPDILIVDPPPAYQRSVCMCHDATEFAAAFVCDSCMLPRYVGAALELKDKARKPTADQLRWLGIFHARSWLVAVERTEHAALSRLVLWGYLPVVVLDGCNPCDPSSTPSSRRRGSAPTRARSSSIRRRSPSS